MIVPSHGKYRVVSHTTGKSLGTYDTKAEAAARLRQIKGHAQPNTNAPKYRRISR